jgi:hypothetical protein
MMMEKTVRCVSGTFSGGIRLNKNLDVLFGVFGALDPEAVPCRVPRAGGTHALGATGVVV